MLNKVNIFLLFIIIITGLSCKHNQFDAPYYANEYCNCLAASTSIRNEAERSIHCDSILMLDNRYINFYILQIENDSLHKAMPQSLKDSITEFVNAYVGYLDTNCAKYFLRHGGVVH